MTNYIQFLQTADKIHRKHIENFEKADQEIALKRINKYFNGELKLSWKSIIYEINKLPELERNAQINRLVEQQIEQERRLITKNYEEIIAKQTLFNFIKNKLKGQKND